MINKKEITDCFKIAGISKSLYYIQPIIKSVEYEVTIHLAGTDYQTTRAYRLLDQYFNIIEDSYSKLVNKRVMRLTTGVL